MSRAELSLQRGPEGTRKGQGKRKALGEPVNPRKVTKSPLTLVPMFSLFLHHPKSPGPASLRPHHSPTQPKATARHSYHPLFSGRVRSLSWATSMALGPSVLQPSPPWPLALATFQRHFPPKFLGRARFLAGLGCTADHRDTPGPHAACAPAHRRPVAHPARPGAPITVRALSPGSAAASAREGPARPPHRPSQARGSRGSEPRPRGFPLQLAEPELGGRGSRDLKGGA